MANSDELTAELLTFCPNVYFQPPVNLDIHYPCIVYRKSGKDKLFGNNETYRSIQEYTITVIDEDPESTIADSLDKEFEYCSINQYFVVDGLNHTTLTIYY